MTQAMGCEMHQTVGIRTGFLMRVAPADHMALFRVVMNFGAVPSGNRGHAEYGDERQKRSIECEGRAQNIHGADAMPEISGPQDCIRRTNGIFYRQNAFCKGCSLGAHFPKSDGPNHPTGAIGQVAGP